MELQTAAQAFIAIFEPAEMSRDRVIRRCPFYFNDLADHRCLFYCISQNFCHEA